MPREIILLDRSAPAYEVGAQFLAVLAYPAAEEEHLRLIFWKALCRQTIIECAAADRDFASSNQAIKPEFFIELTEEFAKKSVAAGFIKINERMVAGHWYAAPVLAQQEQLPQKIKVRGRPPTVNQMAIEAQGDLPWEGLDNSQHVKSRVFAPSKPVLHAALAVQIVIQDHFAGQPGINAGVILHDIEILALVVNRSEIVRAKILQLPPARMRIDEADTIKFVLS
jgi:hypothetical protein